MSLVDQNVVATPTPTPVVRKLAFRGNGATLFGIFTRNLFFIVATLGVYYFWGKTHVRRYLFSEIELDGHRFDYHGTGREMLVGFSRVIVLFLSMWLIIFLSELYISPDLAALFSSGAFLFYMLLAQLTIGAAFRYRMSRTSYRGIRFGFDASLKKWLIEALKMDFLLIVTLGLYTPVYLINKQKFLVGHSRYGNEPIRFTGKGPDLFWLFVLHLFFTPFCLGFNWMSFMASLQRYYWTHTSIRGLTFVSTLRGSSLLGLYVTNALIFVFTFSLGSSWIRTRTLEFYFENLQIIGDLDLTGIVQGKVPSSASGIAVSELLSIDSDFGI